MRKRLVPATATIGSLLIGVVIGWMTLLPANAIVAVEPSPAPAPVFVLEDPLPTAPAECVDAPLGEMPTQITDLDLTIAGIDPDNPPAMIIVEDIDGERVIREPDVGELPHLSGPPLPGHEAMFGCFVTDCAAGEAGNLFHPGNPADLGLEADGVISGASQGTLGITVTEENGRVVATDASGEVLFDIEEPTSGVIGFNVDEGGVSMLDASQLPALSSFDGSCGAFFDGGAVSGQQSAVVGAASNFAD